VLTYWLEVSNQGPSQSSGGQISDTLPAEVDLVASASGCSGVGRTVTCPVGEVAAGGRQQLSFEVEVDAGFEGVLVNSAVLSAADSDPNPGNESATAQTVVDAGPPEVTAVALAGTAVAECAELTTTGSTLAVTYSEAMWDPAGDWEVGDVSNPASYLLVSAGADRDLDTEVCGARATTRRWRSTRGHDPASLSATLAVNGLAASSGTIPLLACATLRDELAGYVLDGDGNGSGATTRPSLPRQPISSFANAHLDWARAVERDRRHVVRDHVQRGTRTGLRSRLGPAAASEQRAGDRPVRGPRGGAGLRGSPRCCGWSL
jgi:hypothetical protein